MRHEQVELHNVRALIPSDGGLSLSRLPQHVLPYLSAGGQRNALAGAGVEARFVLQGEPVTLTVGRSGAGMGIAEVWLGPFQHSLHVLTSEPTAITVVPDDRLPLLQEMAKREILPFDPCVVRVLLPYDYPTLLVDVQGPPAPPAAAQVPARRLLTYGSSITQGASALSPSGTYAFETARALGMDLLNVGLSGSAYLEAALADWIADCGEWDIATLELGINVLYAADWTEERFADAAQYFVQRIARANPDKWVFVLDVLPHHRDWQGEARADGFRAIVQDAVQAVNLPRCVHVDARALLTTAAGLSFDTVHPSAQGMTEIAARLSSLVEKTMAHGV